MPIVHIDLSQLSAVDPGITNLKNASVDFSPYRAYPEADTWVTRNILRVKCPAGVADPDVPATPLGNAYEVQERGFRGARKGYVLVPDVAEVDYVDLVWVDKATLDPETPLDPAWVTALDDVISDVTTAKSTADTALTNAGVASAAATTAQGAAAAAQSTADSAVAGLGNKVNTSTYTAGMNAKADTTALTAEASSRTAADTAIRHRAPFELAQRFKNIANGAVPSPLTGQSVVCFGVPPANMPSVISGKISSTYVPASGTAAGYTQAQLSGQVCRLGGRWTVKGPASGSFGLIAWNGDISLGSVPDSVCHLSISTTGWEYQVVNNSGTFTSLATGTFDTALTADGATVHTAEVVIDADNGVSYVTLPDGTTATVVSALIKTIASTWAVVEEYRGTPTNTLVEILEWWADSQRPGPAIRAARDAAMNTGAWQNLTPLNSWVAFGSTYAPLQWRREGNKVRVRGSIKSGVTTALTNMFTLPLPPAYIVGKTVVGTAGGYGDIIIRGRADGASIQGQCQYVSGGNTQLVMDFDYPIG